MAKTTAAKTTSAKAASAKAPPASRRALDERTTYRFSLLAARQTRCLSEMYHQQFGLTASQWKILPIVGYCGALSAKEVGARTSLEPEKVTRAVDQLVARGFVSRRPDPKDRRRVILTLAPKGRTAFGDSEKIRGIIETAFLDALTAPEIAAFRRILGKLERRAGVMFDGKQSWRRIVGAAVEGKTSRTKTGQTKVGQAKAGQAKASGAKPQARNKAHKKAR